MLGVGIGLLYAQYCSDSLSQPTLGWFVGGWVIGLSLFLRFPVESGKRYHVRVVVAVLLTGVVASAAFNLADRLW